MIVLGLSLLLITYWLLVTMITFIDYLLVISLYITMIVLGLSLLFITYWLLVCI